MSNQSTMYNINFDKLKGLATQSNWVSALLRADLLVPAEPCEHDNYARHPIEATMKVISKTINEATLESVMTYVMCDGNPKENNE